MKKTVKIFFILAITISMILSMFLSSGIAFAKDTTYEGFVNGFQGGSKETALIDTELMPKLVKSIKNMDTKENVFKFYKSKKQFMNTLVVLESEYPELFQFTVNGNNGGETLWIANFLTSIKYNYTMSKKDYKRNLKTIRSIRDQIKKGTASMSDFDKEKYIYDYIARNTTYKNSTADDSTIYGIFINKKGNCTGLSKAFKYLANACGLQCIVVGGYGKSGNGHSWNKVKIDGNWHVVDINKELNHKDSVFKYVDASKYPLVYPAFNVKDSEETDDFKVSKIYRTEPDVKDEAKEYYRVAGLYTTQNNINDIIPKLVNSLVQNNAGAIRCDSKNTISSIEENIEAIQQEYYNQTGNYIALQYYSISDEILYFFVTD